MKSISEQLKTKLETSEEFRKRADVIMNGQIILFIKHGKINMRRFIDDDRFDKKDEENSFRG